MDSDLRPPREALRAWLKDVYRAMGKYESMGRVVARLTGRNYTSPDRTAKAWVDGESDPPASAIAALQMACPELRFTDYMLAPRSEPPGGLSSAVLDQIARDQIATEIERLRELQDGLVTFAIQAGDRLGIDFLAMARAPEPGTVDPRAARFLAELRGETPPEPEDAPEAGQDAPA